MKNKNSMHSAMKVSFKMNITTSGGPHNGILVSTGVHTDQTAERNICKSNKNGYEDSELFYDPSSARNIMDMWRKAQNSLSMESHRQNAIKYERRENDSIEKNLTSLSFKEKCEEFQKSNSPPILRATKNFLPTDASTIASLLLPLKHNKVAENTTQIMSTNKNAIPLAHNENQAFGSSFAETLPLRLEKGSKMDVKKEQNDTVPQDSLYNNEFENKLLEKDGFAKYDSKFDISSLGKLSPVLESYRVTDGYDESLKTNNADSFLHDNEQKTHAFAKQRNILIRKVDNATLPPKPKPRGGMRDNFCLSALPPRASSSLDQHSVYSFTPYTYSSPNVTIASSMFNSLKKSTENLRENESDNYMCSTCYGQSVDHGLTELEYEPYGAISRKSPATKRKINGEISQNCEEELVPLAGYKTPIKLNVFNQDGDFSSISEQNGTTPVELYVTPTLNNNNKNMEGSSDVEPETNDDTGITTTTTVEIFREKLNSASFPVDYFRLPGAPLRDANDKRVDLVRAHGPPYEVAARIDDKRFGDKRKACRNRSNASKVRWEDMPSPSRPLSASSSQPSLNYIIKEPSSLSSSTYFTDTFGGQSRRNELNSPQPYANNLNSDRQWASELRIEPRSITPAYEFKPNVSTHQHLQNLPESIMSRRDESAETINFMPKHCRENSDASSCFQKSSSRSDLHTRSTPSFSSIWNLTDGSGEISDNEEDDNASVATILRYRQRYEKSPTASAGRAHHPSRCALLRNASSRNSENESAIYSRIVTPSPLSADAQHGGGSSMTLQCCYDKTAPPLPPKRFTMRRTNSQPNLIAQNNYRYNEGERSVPPRPCTQKPQHLKQQRIAQKTTLENPNIINTSYLNPSPFAFFELPTPNARRHQPQLSPRHASSNEIFKLYQTRDCLGNVLYEY